MKTKEEANVLTEKQQKMFYNSIKKLQNEVKNSKAEKEKTDEELEKMQRRLRVILQEKTGQRLHSLSNLKKQTIDLPNQQQEKVSIASSLRYSA